MEPATHIDLPSLQAERGHFPDRQTECAGWVAEGKENTAIAILLGISPTTVKHHLKVLMATVDVHTRAQLVFKLTSQGILTAKHLMMVLCVTLTAGAVTAYPRPVLAGELNISNRNSGSAPFTQMFRMRGGGRNQQNRINRTTRISRTTRKEH